MNPTLRERFRLLIKHLFFKTAVCNAKKYIVTDSGGSGDITKPTHYFNLEITLIKGEKSIVKFECERLPSPSSRFMQLKEIQELMPAKEFGDLQLKLITKQQLREQGEIFSLQKAA